ncbi:MAG: glycosyltransferase family 2 protein [Bdellovibrionales bacterium]|nr:glycosyltransferase family 2 protein [Bdellovibrionales bacterium]
MRLSVVLPCHNEESAIPIVLPKLLSLQSEILKQTGLSEIEIIVVNDGSTDQSENLLHQYLSEISLISFPTNRGYGNALKEGFRQSKGDLIAFYDLDDTCQPEDLVSMVNLLKEDRAGMVCGNRLNAQSKMPFLRCFGNWLYRRLTVLLLGIELNDCCTGMRVFRSEYRHVFCSHLPHHLNFSLAMTVLFLRQKGVYREIPIQYHRRLGDSKLSIFSDGPLFLWTLVKFSLLPFYKKAR